MSQFENYPMVAKTMAELEDVLAEELVALGANDVEVGTRMVSFTGNKALMYKANVHCRTALRILKPIHEFKASNADEVYESVKAMDWGEYLTLDKTFSIDAVVFSHIFKHSKFVTYRVKDAIVDWFYEKYGKRPSVSVTNPDLVFNIHVSHNKCTLSLDSSGESLHKRGYRIVNTEAPLNEVLAAGMILKSGWRGESTFVDPMCGSGTLLIEAAMIATGTPPGIHRQGFGFEKWNDFDDELFSEIYNDDSSSRDFDFRIIGSDVSARAISAAEQNVKNAGMKKYIDLSLMPIQQYTEAPQPAGVLMTNPPYGERLKVDDLDDLYSMIGERLKHVFVGYDSFILSYKKELFDKIGLKPSKRFFLFNGSLECEMREYKIFAGKRNEFDPENRDESAIKREKRSRKFLSYDRNSKEGYRRSKREGDYDEGDVDYRRDSFDRDQPFESENRREGGYRQQRDGRSDRPRRDFERGRTANRDRKPFDRNRSFDRDSSRSFNKENKHFERRGGSFDDSHKSFDRSNYLDRGEKPVGREKSFGKDRGPQRSDRPSYNREGSGDDYRDSHFDRDRRPRKFKHRDFDSRSDRGSGIRDNKRSDGKPARKRISGRGETGRSSAAEE